MALRILPPGKSDFFKIPPYPYRFLISLLPEPEKHTAHHSDPEFNLKNPTYYTRVFSGEKIIAEGDSQSALMFDGLDLQYFKHKYWVQLESAKDSGIPIMKYGIFLIVFGIPVYVLNIFILILKPNPCTS